MLEYRFHQLLNSVKNGTPNYLPEFIRIEVEKRQ